jgi:hypothetical protein
MDGKFLGLGLGNIIGLFVLFILLIVISKVAFNKYQVPGATDVINAV